MSEQSENHGQGAYLGQYIPAKMPDKSKPHVWAKDPGVTVYYSRPRHDPFFMSQYKDWD